MASIFSSEKNMAADEGSTPEAPKTPILDSLSGPSDLRKLALEKLPVLCAELRQELIHTVSETGGHFASSLGVVELTVAAHYVFDTPRDRIVWDVGHQSYIHKILTGRRGELKNVRKRGGISGFPRREESEYDTFGVAHAGTSISAASGMLEASCQLSAQGEESKALAIIGDGAMTAGMAFEALNHSGETHRNLIVILNDNEMSIAPNVGAMSKAFSGTIANEFSTSARKHFKSLVDKKLIPHFFYRFLDKAEEAAQGFLSTPAMLFGAFGYRYLGPVDGHDVLQIVKFLERAKKQDGPVLIHALTIKGKGYEPAEADPVKYHGVSPFTVKCGGFKQAPLRTYSAPPSYTKVFGDTMVELAKEDDRLVGITAAMRDGTGLSRLAEEFPDKYFDVGIAEQHAVTFAAGMACEGMRPVCAIYSTFLQRAYDQVIHDVCIQNLPVIFAMDRAGMVGADGATHHGVFDLSYLRILPNMTVMAAKDEAELRDMLYTAICHEAGPSALRYPRGNGMGVDISSPPKRLVIGQGEVIDQSRQSDVLLLGLGLTVKHCQEAALELSSSHGISCDVLNARFVKPLDKELLAEYISKHSLIITVEDHVTTGGFGSALVELACDLGLLFEKRFIRMGIPDEFIEHGSQKELYEICGFDVPSIVNKVLRELGVTRLQLATSAV